MKEDDRKVAMVEIPLPQETKQGCKGKNTSCGCTCLKFSIAAGGSQNIAAASKSLSIENRQKLLKLIEELEQEYAQETNRLRDEWRSNVADLERRLSEAQRSKDREIDQYSLQHKQSNQEVQSLRIQLTELRERCAIAEKQRDGLIRNKVTFIEANLAEKNMQLQHEISCLKLLHKQQLDKGLLNLKNRQAELLQRIEEQKQNIPQYEGKIRILEEEIKKSKSQFQQNHHQNTLDRSKIEDLNREIARLKAQAISNSQIGRNEVQLIKQHLEDYKQRLRNAETKITALHKQRDQHFKVLLQTKSEVERRVERVKQLEGELKHRQELNNIKLSELNKDSLNKIRVIEDQLRVKSEQFARSQSYWPGQLDRAKREWQREMQQIVGNHDEYIRRLHMQQQQNINKMQAEINERERMARDQGRQDAMRETKPPQKIPLKTEYVYIEKQSQNPQFKILQQKFSTLSGRSVSLQCQVENLKLENSRLKDRLTFLQNQQQSYNSDKSRWRQEKQELLKRIAQLEMTVGNRGRFEWVAEKIIDAEREGRDQHFHYHDVGLKVIDTTQPNITYRVIPSENIQIQDKLRQLLPMAIEKTLHGGMGVMSGNQVGGSAERRTIVTRVSSGGNITERNITNS